MCSAAIYFYLEAFSYLIYNLESLFWTSSIQTIFLKYCTHSYIWAVYFETGLSPLFVILRYLQLFFYKYIYLYIFWCIYFDEFMRILYSLGCDIIIMKRRYLCLTKSVINSFFSKLDLYHFQSKRLIYPITLYQIWFDVAPSLVFSPLHFLVYSMFYQILGAIFGPLLPSRFS